MTVEQIKMNNIKYLILSLCVFTSAHAKPFEVEINQIKERANYLFYFDSLEAKATDFYKEKWGEFPENIQSQLVLPGRTFYKAIFICKDSTGSFYNKEIVFNTLTNKPEFNEYKSKKSIDANTGLLVKIKEGVKERKYLGLCPTTYNRIIFYNQNKIYLYLISSSSNCLDLIIGKHFRFVYDTTGILIDSTLTSNQTCMVLKKQKGKARHGIDLNKNMPNEFHLFISKGYHNPLYLPTENNFWEIINGNVQLFKKDKDKDKFQCIKY